MQEYKTVGMGNATDPQSEIQSVPLRTIIKQVAAIALVLACLGFWVLKTPSGQKASGYVPPVVKAAQVETRTGMAPAPKLKRGPTKTVKGKKMATWIATLAGDATYNGTYVESGTYNGQPAYTNGTYWLWYSTTDTKWALSANKGDTPAFTWGYQGAAATPSLPANPWGYQSGTAPAPTLADTTPVLLGTTASPYTCPYVNYWGVTAVITSPIEPRVCTLGGTAYLVLPYDSYSPYGFALFNLSTHLWYKVAASSRLFATALDPYQSAGCFDKGDSTIWLFSGCDQANGTPAFQCDNWDPLTATQITTQAVTLTDPTITNMVQIAAGSYRFCLRDGGDLSYCAYTGGASSYTTLATWVDGDWEPLPLGYTEGTTDQAINHKLLRLSNGAVVYLRRASDYVAAYSLTSTNCTKLPDHLQAYGTNEMQTWGEYNGKVMGDLYWPGSLPDTGALSWLPGTDAICRPTLAAYPFGRRWVVPHTPPLLAGWSEDGVTGGRPWVLYAEPVALTAGYAAQSLAGYPARVAYKLTVGYAAQSLAGYPVTLEEKVLVYAGYAEQRLEGYPVRLVQTAGRARTAVTLEVSKVRVRSLT